MSEHPDQLPEGALIAAALKRARLSVRAAAPRAGISEGRWRQIVSGYQIVSAGTRVPVRGPADTLARMAQVVGVTPDQLDEAGRSDAADELRRLDAQAPTAEDLATRIAELRAEADRLEREMRQLAEEGDEDGPALDRARHLMALARRELDQVRRTRDRE